MRNKQLERNALIVTIDYLRDNRQATTRELWFNLYRADIHVPLNTYRRWLRHWTEHCQHINLMRFSEKSNRYKYALATNQPQQTFVALMQQVDQFLAE